MIFETLEQKRAKAKKIKLEAERLLSENKKLVEEIKTQEVEEERKRNRYEKFREMFGISIVSDNYNIYPEEEFSHLEGRFANDKGEDDEELIKELREEYAIQLEQRVKELNEEIKKYRKRLKEMKQ